MAPRYVTIATLLLTQLCLGPHAVVECSDVPRSATQRRSKSKSATVAFEAKHVFAGNSKLLKLCEAIENGDEKTVKVCISDGADVKATGRFGLTVLHWAFHTMQCDLDGLPDRSQIVVALLASGADPNIRCRKEPRDWVANLNESLVLGVNEYGPCHPQGAAPIHLAAGHTRNHGVLIPRLLEHGGDLNLESSGPGKKTPLHWAVLSSNFGAVNALLQAGVDVRKRDGYGQLPLDLAHDFRVAVALLDKGSPFERKPSFRFVEINDFEGRWPPFLYRAIGQYHSILSGTFNEPDENDGPGWREYASFWRAIAILRKEGVDIEKYRADFVRSMMP